MGWLILGVLPWLVRKKFNGARATAAPPPQMLDEIIVAQCAVALLQAGMPIPRVLEAVGSVIERSSGHQYDEVSERLQAGRGWDNSWQGCEDPYHLEPALRAAWLEGINPTAALRHHIEHTLRVRVSHAKTQAAILGVKIVLPLGLCLLPAFVLLGLVPSMLSSGLSLG